MHNSIAIYLGLGNNPLNGIEIAGADWWRLTKSGSLELIKETNDRFNIVYDTEGYEIARLGSGSMGYIASIDKLAKGLNVKNVFGKNSEFIELRVDQAQLISANFMIMMNAVYNKMVERAKATHWYSAKLFEQARKAGDLESKKAGNSAIDIFTTVFTYAVTRGMTPGGTSAGLNSYQKFNLATSLVALLKLGL